MVDDVGHAHACNDYKGDGEAEQADEGEFALERDLRTQDDGDGKGDEEDIGNHVGGAHGDELCIALSALRAGVWHDLPILRCC